MFIYLILYDRGSNGGTTCDIPEVFTDREEFLERLAELEKAHQTYDVRSYSGFLEKRINK